MVRLHISCPSAPVGPWKNLHGSHIGQMIKSKHVAASLAGPCHPGSPPSTSMLHNLGPTKYSCDSVAHCLTSILAKRPLPAQQKCTCTFCVIKGRHCSGQMSSNTETFSLGILEFERHPWLIVGTSSSVARLRLCRIECSRRHTLATHHITRALDTNIIAGTTFLDYTPEFLLGESMSVMLTRKTGVTYTNKKLLGTQSTIILLQKTAGKSRAAIS